MNKLYKFLNYNYIKIIKGNINNNNKNNLNKKEKKELSNLILKKEICSIIFIIINFLITYVSTKEIYKISYRNNIFIHILKDNILTSIIWFIILSILPLITNIMITKKVKSKYYLIPLTLYLISNLFNILLVIYFITALINNIILSIIGIINIIMTLIININIIINIKEKYLK